MPRTPLTDREAQDGLRDALRARGVATLTPAPAPVEPATAAWRALGLVRPDIRQHILGAQPLVGIGSEDPVSAAFDLLRTRLLRVVRRTGWRRIAIAAPSRGCGSTFTAVNLAQSLARVPGCRTVLMDLNQRAPGVGPALGIDAAGQEFGDLRGFLSGKVALNRYLVRTGEALAVGLAAAGTGAGAAESLLDGRCPQALERMMTTLRPDVVLYDLPPVLEHDDLVAVLPQVDAVLLVADGTRTVARQIDACQRLLADQTSILGVVLNRARG